MRDWMREIGAATGARYLVRTEIAVEGRDYNLQLVLLRADTGAPVVTSADLCEICGHEELADRVGDVASALRRNLGAAVEPPPRLRVLTRPDGSEVLLDGVHVGDTPLDPFMVASVDPRDGVSPAVGEPVAGDNSINGGDRSNEADDLQYACTFALAEPQPGGIRLPRLHRGLVRRPAVRRHHPDRRQGLPRAAPARGRARARRWRRGRIDLPGCPQRG